MPESASVVVPVIVMVFVVDVTSKLNASGASLSMFVIVKDFPESAE